MNILTDKVAVVTSASQGIGAAIAKSLAAAGAPAYLVRSLRDKGGAKALRTQWRKHDQFELGCERSSRAQVIERPTFPGDQTSP